MKDLYDRVSVFSLGRSTSKQEWNEISNKENSTVLTKLAFPVMNDCRLGRFI